MEGFIFGCFIGAGVIFVIDQIVLKNKTQKMQTTALDAAQYLEAVVKQEHGVTVSEEIEVEDEDGNTHTETVSVRKFASDAVSTAFSSFMSIARNLKLS